MFCMKISDMVAYFQYSMFLSPSSDTSDANFDDTHINLIKMCAGNILPSSVFRIFCGGIRNLGTLSDFNDLGTCFGLQN